MMEKSSEKDSMHIITVINFLSSIMKCKTNLFFVIVIAILASSFFGCSPRDFEAPNIVLIMADDLGYGDIGCFGNEEIQTPAIDQLAIEGMRFTDFHSNGAVCSPTRAALLTGRYQQRSGIEGVIRADPKSETRQRGLSIEEVTIADHMKEAGYKTGIVGKWHLGYRVEFNPINQGFDYYRGYVSGNVDYHSHVDQAGFPDWWHDLEKVEEKGYVTDLITKYSIEFIEEHQDQPFFLYVAHEAPHYPFQGRKDKADRYPGFRGKRIPVHGTRKDRKGAYKEMIEVMDEGIGKIMAKLEELKLKTNTLVIFCSDNGGIKDIGNNGKLHGTKGSLWEGGHRVPAIAVWPGYVKQGSVSNETVLSMDFFPTFVNLSKSEKNEEFDFDGVDITRLLIEGHSLADRTVFWRYGNQKSARFNNWKLIIDNDTTKLFDLGADISETINLVNLEENMTNQLEIELNQWEKEVLSGVKLKSK